MKGVRMFKAHMEKEETEDAGIEWFFKNMIHVLNQMNVKFNWLYFLKSDNF